MDLPVHFKELLSTIEPEDIYVAKAKAAHEQLRKELRNDEELGKAHRDTYLSGSYVRHTAIRHIKDVDVICVLDIDKDVTNVEQMLAFVQQTLQKYYTNVRRQDRSICVVTPQGVHLDVVPATPKSSENGPLWIPDRDARRWVDTHPKGQIDFAQQRNSDTGGYYVQIVKLLKYWRDKIPLESARPKSYILESLVAHSIGTSEPASHAAAIVKVLEGIYQKYKAYVGTGTVPSIPDPGYPSKSVSKRWSSSEFDAFMREVGNAANIARKAWEATSETTSLQLWRKIFGNEF